MPQGLRPRLQATLFFGQEIHYFRFGKRALKVQWITVRARESLNLLYIFENFTLDPDRRELRCGATVIAMEPQAFDLLVHLIRHREHVVSRDELIEQIWDGRIVSESALSTRINTVRKAIGDSGNEQRLIKTLPRKGIRFVGEVREGPEPCEASAAILPERGSEAVDAHAANGGLPASQASATEIFNGDSEASTAIVPTAIAPRRAIVPRATVATLAISLLCLAVLSWGYFAHSAQVEQTKANIETAAKLTQVAGKINVISREDYQAVRTLGQWAVDLDPNNAEALTRLTHVLTTGVLNHWSDDLANDLHAADQALQSAARIAPDSMGVRGAQCHILRAMRRFEVAIEVCGEAAQSFPTYPFLHKEIGYNKLMLGQLDEALAEFQEADRIAPESRLRWSWYQGEGLVYLMQGEDSKAIDYLSRATLEAPNTGHPAAYLASAYALVGREQEARDALDHYMKLWPKTALNNFGPMVGTAAFNNKMERVLKGLRLAGLSE
jgi:DNA-binding winged helix-turn-helix (wHTH) protein/tetratricopeptide (TPR) repeat protein